MQTIFFTRASLRALLVSAVVLLLASSCAHDSYTRVPRANAVDDRLYCGRNVPSGREVTDEELQTFLREVVTPRFPDGLTVWAATGQWRNAVRTVERERVMVLEIVHPLTRNSDRLIREVADEYRRRFRQESVLRVTQPATMQFITSEQ